MKRPTVEQVGFALMMIGLCAVCLALLSGMVAMAVMMLADAHMSLGQRVLLTAGVIGVVILLVGVAMACCFADDVKFPPPPLPRFPRPPTKE